MWIGVFFRSPCYLDLYRLKGCHIDDSLVGIGCMVLGMLTDKQKETFEKFDDCWDELTDINEREIFVYAFKLGARIAIDVLTER